MATKVIENLITQLGFEFDDKAVKKFNDGVETAAKGMLAIVAGAGVAAAGIFAFTKSVASANDATGKLSKRIGVDLGAMQELGYVAELNGGSIDSMNGSLENLAKITSEASRGMGAGVEVFGMLGLSATDAAGQVKSADSMLLEISDSVSQLGTQAEKLEFAQKLGIGSDLLLSIQDGSDAMREQMQRAKALGFAIGESGAKKAAAFNDSLLDMTTIFKGLSSFMATKVMPVFTKIMEAFAKFYIANKKLIQSGLTSFFKSFMDVLSGVFNITVRLFGVINSVVQGFGGWKNAIMIVVGAFAILNASVLFLPILLAALGAALFLIIEDLIKFQQGGDSAVGSLLEKFPLLSESLHILLGWIGKIAEGWKLIFSDEFGNAIEGAIMMFNDLKNVLAGVGADILNFLINPINKAINLINKIPGINIEGLGNVGGSDEASQTNPVPTAAAGQTNNTTSKTTTKTSSPSISIAINGGDTADVKKTITEVLNEQYTGANTNLESAVEV